MALTDQEKQEWLRRVPIFAACTDDEVRRVAQKTVEIAFPAGRQIMRQGEVSTGFYVIVEGGAAAQSGGKTVAVFGPGEFFGELALLDRGPRTATVVATTDTRTLGIASWDFLAILEEDHTITLKLLYELAHRLRRTISSPVA